MADKEHSDFLPDMPDLPRRMENLVRSLLGHQGVSQEGVWHPPVNVYDTDDALIVELDVPGMKGRDVEVSIEENHLYVEGRRQMQEGRREQDLYYSERPMGEFHRVIHLPQNVEAESTEATYQDGVLTVKMPKIAREKGRRIEIK